jgi:hypothetical protein
MLAMVKYFRAVELSVEQLTLEVDEIRRRDANDRAAGVELVERVRIFGHEFAMADSEHFDRCAAAARRYGVGSLLVDEETKQ